MPNSSRCVSFLLLREPMVHFFGIGALIFLVHHFVVGDPRTIAITPALKAELTRRFQDQHGTKPDPAQLATEVRKWQRDEALFREALSDHLDRDDPSVRAALVDKMHARAAFEVPKREPSDADLSAWLASHRALYETPLRYDFEFLAMPKAERAAAAQLDEIERRIKGGAEAGTLGRPVIGGNLTALDLKGRLEPELAERIPSLPPAQWQRLEGKQTLWLVRVKQIEGGLPSLEALRPRLVADWSFATQQQAIDLILQHTIDRYRFEQRP